MKEIPFSIQWPIAENRLLPLKDSINGRIFSTSVSNIPEFEYYMEISPNGDSDERRGETWIFLHLKFKNVKKVEADFTFTIEAANYSHEIHYAYEQSVGWGHRCVCKTKEFFDPEKKYITDGKLTIKVDGIFKYENDAAVPVAIEQKWSGGTLGDGFWKKDGTKDFTIITSDGKEIKVHKYVLDVRSEVFEAMLNSNMKETTENKVAIPDFTFNVVETALKIIYDCNFTTKLSMDELISLLQFLDKYLLPELKAKVEPYLISQISASTVVSLTNGSVQTNSTKLKEKCMEFLSVSFAAKTSLTDFDNLDKDIIFEVVKNSFCQTLEIEEQ